MKQESSCFYAQECQSQCIEANPSLFSNYWYLGLAWLLVGEELEAQAVWLSAIVEGTPQEVDARTFQLLRILETEAMRFFDSGKAHLAEKIYGQVLQVEDGRADIYYALGMAINLANRQLFISEELEAKPGKVTASVYAFPFSPFPGVGDRPIQP